MKFIKISSSTYVNLEQVKEITLNVSLTRKYYWAFIYDISSGEEAVPTGAFSKTFDTKQEAFEWFDKNIKPFMETKNGQDT